MLPLLCVLQPASLTSTLGRMIVSLTTAGPMRPTRHAKRMIAQAMLVRGSHFLGAALLVEKNGGYRYVVLHLVCQGLEIVQKALLLAHDYDRFIKKIADRKKFGHDLLKGAHAVIACYGLRPMRPSLESELGSLNGFYASHHLRYASMVDILIDPASISYVLVLRRTAALLRFGRKITKTA